MPDTILLIEDDPHDLELAAESLRLAGVQGNVVVARDGEEALAYLHGRGRFTGRILPELVLLDVGLPKISGLELLALIRGERSLRNLRVVMLTGSRDEAIMLRGLDLGVEEFLAKPLMPDSIVAVVTRAH